MCSRCVRTVAGEMKSRRLIWRFVRLRATRASTSSSRSVRAGRWGRRSHRERSRARCGRSSDRTERSRSSKSGPGPRPSSKYCAGRADRSARALARARIPTAASRLRRTGSSGIALRHDVRSPKRHSTYAAASAGIASRIASTVSMPKAALRAVACRSGDYVERAVDIALAEGLHAKTVERGNTGRQGRVRPRPALRSRETSWFPRLFSAPDTSRPDDRFAMEAAGENSCDIGCVEALRWRRAPGSRLERSSGYHRRCIG